MRTSRLENEVQNGCTVGSSRYEPSVKPSVSSTRSSNWRCLSAWKGTSRKDASTSGASFTSSVSAGWIASKTSATSVDVMKGSKSSSSTVYGESSHSKQST